MAHLFLSDIEQDPELVEVDEWTEEEEPYRGRSHPQWLPDSLDLDFETRLGHVILHLTKSDHVDSAFPVMLGVDGQIVKWTDTAKQQV